MNSLAPSEAGVVVMRVLQSFVVAAAMIVFVCAPVSAETFASKEGRFTVSILAKPTMAKTSVQAGAQSMVMYSYSAVVEGGSLAIVYSDLPAGVPPADRIDNILDGAANGIVTNTNGSLVKSDKTEVAGCPARDLLWTVKTTNAEIRGRASLILVGDRMYQVLAVGSGPFATSQPILDFFNSFKFDRAPEASSPAKTKTRKRATPKSRPRPTTSPARTPAEWRAFNVKNNDGGYTVQRRQNLNVGKLPAFSGSRIAQRSSVRRRV